MEKPKDITGDRECPNCGEVSLIEEGATQWVCLNCGEIYDEKDLDYSEE
ncbi:hypothetical protein P4284_23730 [Bacillus swezeyi]|nr:hypothetical protein [Bacillus swezeyi]MED2979663.1 hypothetical protein [Bacillus swezeyi]